MKCVNCWCKHWVYNSCKIAAEIFIDNDGFCKSYVDEESFKIIQERIEWQKQEEEKLIMGKYYKKD